MSTNGINEAFNAGFKVKLQNRGPKSSGITFELKSVFDEMAKQGLIKDTDGKELTKQDALNLYAKLNEMHQETNRATNYTRMQAGQEFNYTADEMKALAQAAGYEIIEEAPAEVGSEPQEETPAVEPSIDEAPIAEPPEGEDSEYDQAITVGVKPEEEKSSIADLKQQIKDNKAENKELRQEIRAQRREARIERREERRSERAERRNARIQAKIDSDRELKAEEPIKPIVTGPANDPEYEKGRLSLVEEDFNANGQVGKISQGKYYINGTEVAKEVYEVAKNKANANATVKEKTMTEKQLAEYLNHDSSYQKYKNSLAQMDNIMKELETKYNFNRGDFRDETNMHFANETDGNKYSQAKWNYNLYSRALPQYEKEMAEWKDGSCGKDSYYRHNSTTWTNLERITLANGQRAWKTDQGTFYPGPNGMPGYDKVPQEEL